MADRRCTFKRGQWNCGSYQFNLYKDDIDQGDLCDVHYWQTRAQPAQEPVAQWQKKHATETEGKWENTDEFDAKWWRDCSKGWEIRTLQTTPPQRPWVGLTDDELYEIVRAEGKVLKAHAWEIVQNLQAALKEKNFD